MASPPETDRLEVPPVPVPLTTQPPADSSSAVVGMEDFSPEDRDPRPLHIPPLRRILLVLGILGGLAALVFVPPLVSMNHYRRQIASSIAASLGRPVRIDSVALNVFPMPGLTLKNFVVSEDPAFGAEPIIRANSVAVMLRVSSLWGRRVEFSRIALDAPSVNLVRLPDGRWNLESILLQASHVKAAPTTQVRAGSAPRFPYIEATGARLNFKSGIEKLPISLTDASFALWLPQPDRWQLRLEAHPTRTDAAAADTGTFRLEGSLGHAGRLPDVPVNLVASWSDAPLGAASWILLGRDAGVRGNLAIQATVNGSAGDSVLSTQLQLSGLRRAEFVPEQPLAVDLRCNVHALALFHRLEQIRCEWPQENAPGGLVLSGSLANVPHPADARAQAIFKGVPAAALLNAGKAGSPRIARDLRAEGALSGDLQYGRPNPVLAAAPTAGKSGKSSAKTAPPIEPALAGNFKVAAAQLSLSDAKPFVLTDVDGTVEANQLTVPPFPILLGGATPALLSAHADRSGYTLHLSGPVLRSRLRQLAGSLPQFGDGLPPALIAPAGGVVSGATAARTPESVLRVDLNSSRPWGGAQTWSSPAQPVRPAPRHNTRNRGIHSPAR